MSPRNVIVKKAPTVLAIIGAAYMFFWAMRNGPVMHSDSYEYFNAATIVAEGNPFVQGDNSLLYFAPLYPFLLGGLVRALRVSVEHAARLLGAGIFGLNIYMGGKMLRAATGSAGAGAAVSLILLASPRFRLDHAEALSDSLFTLICQVALMGIFQYGTSGARRWIPIAALAAGMSAFTRYIGYATVIAASLGLMYLAYRKTRETERWTTMSIIVGFVGLGVVPSILWQWRNLVLHGVLSGGDVPKSKLTMLDAVSRLTSDTGQYWAWSIGNTPVHTVTTVIVILVAVAGALRSQAEYGGRRLFSSWVFAATYALTLVIAASALKVQWRSEYGEPLFVVVNGLFVAGCQSLIAPLTTSAKYTAVRPSP